MFNWKKWLLGLFAAFQIGISNGVLLYFGNNWFGNPEYYSFKNWKLLAWTIGISIVTGVFMYFKSSPMLAEPTVVINNVAPPSA